MYDKKLQKRINVIKKHNPLLLHQNKNSDFMIYNAFTKKIKNTFQQYHCDHVANIYFHQKTKSNKNQNHNTFVSPLM